MTVITRVLERRRLDNGLRVVAAHRPGPVASVAVHHGVGFRNEPEGRSGFAHLFEHLMFQGSEAYADEGHARAVQTAGGSANGATQQDCTDFHAWVPVGALDRLLALESARMHAPLLTPRHLAVQVAVVQEEIRQQVLDKPYGGFPWTRLPALMFDSYAHAHDGYGDLEGIAAATLDEARDFFRTSYAPANAVVTVVSPLDPREAADRVERWFGSVPARSGPYRADEPRRDTRGRRAVHRDQHARYPAVAVGTPLEGPERNLQQYLATWVLTRLLAGGPSTPLHTEVTAGRALSVHASCGYFGPLRSRDPDVALVVATLPPGTGADPLLATLDDALARAADGRVPAEDVERAVTGLRAQHLRGVDDVTSYARALGTAAVLFDDPLLVVDLPERLGEVHPDHVAQAAARLAAAPKSVLQLEPAAASTTGHSHEEATDAA